MLIIEDNLENQETQKLIALHLKGMHSITPEEFVFALDLKELKQPNIFFYSSWEGEKITGIGALKLHPNQIGEIKSMRTHPDYLRRGVGELILRHLINVAKQKKITSLYLETGTAEEFLPAIYLYKKLGFVEAGPFAEYKANSFSRFFKLILDN